MSNELWSAVIAQSLDDLAAGPLGSGPYDDAVAFFTETVGEWRESRVNIANLIGVHEDDLERCGRRRIIARRLAEGLPAEAAPTPRPASRLPTKIRGLVALPAPAKRHRADSAPSARRGGWFKPQTTTHWFDTFLGKTAA